MTVQKCAVILQTNGLLIITSSWSGSDMLLAINQNANWLNDEVTFLVSGATSGLFAYSGNSEPAEKFQTSTIDFDDSVQTLRCNCGGHGLCYFISDFFLYFPTWDALTSNNKAAADFGRKGAEFKCRIWRIRTFCHTREFLNIDLILILRKLILNWFRNVMT